MRSHLGSWQWTRLLLILGLGLVVASCDAPLPTPESGPPEEPGTAVASGGGTRVVPTVRLTVTAEATQPLTSTSTVTPTSSATPSPTPTLTPTPTSMPTPSLTPGPAPEPSVRLEAAFRQQANGDYDQAIGGYQALLSEAPGTDETRRARFHLAESLSLNREHAAAAAAWQDFIAKHPDDDRIPQASLMAARALAAADDCVEAIPYYTAYLSHESILADLVYEWMGDCRTSDEAYEDAIPLYRQALGLSGDRSARAEVMKKVAGAYLAVGDVGAAVSEYDAILGIVREGADRAEVEYQAGQALADSGQADAAYQRYRRAVDGYPETEHAYLSLLELLDAGIPVDGFEQGLVNYHAGGDYPDAYGAAILAFDGYLASGTAQKAGEALYYKALAHRELDQPGDALATLETIITGYAQSQWVADAWLEKAATLAQMDDNDGAVETYQDVAALFAAGELAPKAWWRAAKLREKEGAYGEAAALFETVQATYPGYVHAAEALWREGLSHYRAGTPDTAIATWQALMDKYPNSAYRARALYWLGKLGARAGLQPGGDYWDQLAKEQPHSYYTLRAQQVRVGGSMTATRLVSAAVEPPPWNAAQAETEMRAWMSGWTGVPTNTSLVDVPASVRGSASFQRGQALLDVALRSEALEAFDEVLSSAWNKPLLLSRLAFFYREQGLHGLAARSALRLVGLWPYGTVEDAPLAVQRLAYPLVYADLLSAEAQAHNLDPLLLAALIRQESLFEPVAESWAGARGLGQVMPATGKGIAKALKIDDFVLDDLYRPSVSVRFGAHYLAVQMERFDNQVLMSLAAYHGGPGNTLRWAEAGGDDLDLFVEFITVPTSRGYLQRVYQHYVRYEALYRSEGSGG